MTTDTHTGRTDPGTRLGDSLQAKMTIIHLDTATCGIMGYTAYKATLSHPHSQFFMVFFLFFSPNSFSWPNSSCACDHSAHSAYKSHLPPSFLSLPSDDPCPTPPSPQAGCLLNPPLPPLPRCPLPLSVFPGYLIKRRQM